MLDEKLRNDLAVGFGNIASEAGKIIMAHYGDRMRVNLKVDGSPVTAADLEAERSICARVDALFPAMPLFSEESFKTAQIEPFPDLFILVDPLDGTRDFINGSDEFTVNIALVDHRRPVVGCIYAPALGRMYVAGAAAFASELQPGEVLPPVKMMREIVTSPYPASGLRAVASRSHLDPATDQLLARLPIAARRPAGSSLKFCIIAQGDADVYPRLASTMEWDTAAGHAILAAAGGCVLGLDGQPLSYGKAEASLHNDRFIAWGREPMWS